MEKRSAKDMDTLSALASTTTISATSTTSSSSTSEDELEESKIEFLELLLTQLENQDPLDPMDVNEWTAQLVAYSQLEQQMEMNTELSEISSLLTQNAVSSNFSYIGQTVEVSTDISLASNDSGTLEASWNYSIEETPSSVTLTVTDADGNTVWEGEGTLSSGASTLTLDEEDLDGISDGDLLYLSVSAIDANGDSIDTETSSYLNVDGVQSDDDTVYLTSGSLSFTLDDILKIST